jgi:hypothetical protein
VSGHRPFAELTQNFTSERQCRVDDEYAELHANLLLYELPDEKERRRKMSGSVLGSYRSRSSPILSRVNSPSMSVRRSGNWVMQRIKIVASRNRSLFASDFDTRKCATVLPDALSSITEHGERYAKSR